MTHLSYKLESMLCRKKAVGIRLSAARLLYMIDVYNVLRLDCPIGGFPFSSIQNTYKSEKTELGSFSTEGKTVFPFVFIS